MTGQQRQTGGTTLRTFISRELVLPGKKTRQANRSTPENVRGSRLEPVGAGFAGNFTRSRTFSADGLKRYSPGTGASFARSAGAETRRAFVQKNIRMQPDNNETEESEEQSRLTDNILLCEECAPDPRKATPELEKTNEEVDEIAYYESFECPNCGGTGSVKKRQGSGAVSVNGSATTPKRIDMARQNAWGRGRGW